MSTIVVALALASATADTTAELRGSALATVRRHCVPCHDGSDEDRSAAAIAVFDVVSTRWYASMSEEQLGSAAGRVEGKADARAAASFRAFVRAELAGRT